jgi:hypothetical protein
MMGMCHYVSLTLSVMARYFSKLDPDKLLWNDVTNSDSNRVNLRRLGELYSVVVTQLLLVHTRHDRAGRLLSRARYLVLGRGA